MVCQDQVVSSLLWRFEIGKARVVDITWEEHVKHEMKAALQPVFLQHQALQEGPSPPARAIPGLFTIGSALSPPRRAADLAHFLHHAHALVSLPLPSASYGETLTSQTFLLISCSILPTCLGKGCQKWSSRRRLEHQPRWVCPNELLWTLINIIYSDEGNVRTGLQILVSIDDSSTFEVSKSEM